MSRSAIESSASGASPSPQRGGISDAPVSALAIATRASSAIPMTSPVDCMNGPTDGSTPLSLAVENAGALTATNDGSGRRPAGQPEPGERRAEGDPDGKLDHRHPRHLRHERHRPRGARVDLDQVHAVVADDELGVDEAAGAERDADPLHRPHDQVAVALRRRAAAGTRRSSRPSGRRRARRARAARGSAPRSRRTRRRRPPRSPRGSGRCAPAGRGRRSRPRPGAGRGPRASRRSRWRGRR